MSPPWKERTVLLTHNKSTLYLGPGMRSSPESTCMLTDGADATHMVGYAGTWAQARYKRLMLLYTTILSSGRGETFLSV